MSIGVIDGRPSPWPKSAHPTRDALAALPGARAAHVKLHPPYVAYLPDQSRPATQRAFCPSRTSPQQPARGARRKREASGRLERDVKESSCPFIAPETQQGHAARAPRSHNHQRARGRVQKRRRAFELSKAQSSARTLERGLAAHKKATISCGQRAPSRLEQARREETSDGYPIKLV